jgi:parvulin-like peptidyl-prolyl isomerase
MPKRRSILPQLLVTGLAILAVARLSGEDAWLEPSGEVICHVNNQKIGKRDVENRIDPLILGRLDDFKRRAIAEDRWNPETRKQYHDLLMPDFRNALRGLVKEKLMLQETKERKLEIDETEYQARLDRFLLQMRTSNAWIKPDFDGARAFLREQMLIQAFRNTLVTLADLPNKPQIEKYYAEHQAQYTRPAMVKLRILKVNAERKESTEKRARDTAQDLWKDVVAFGVNFADLAREKSDDEGTRPRGGLMLGPEGEPFIDPGLNRILAPVVRKLGTGSVAERTSKVFEMDNGWAFVFLEERRPAGPAGLDSALFDKIRETLVQEVVKQKEKDWFLQALKRSLVLDSRSKPIPLTFFFHDDPTIVDEPGPSAQNTGASDKGHSSKER